MGYSENSVSALLENVVFLELRRRAMKCLLVRVQTAKLILSHTAATKLPISR